MADEPQYRDANGNPCTLDALCSKEPAWAANRIRVMREELEKLHENARTHRAQLRAEVARVADMLSSLQEASDGFKAQLEALDKKEGVIADLREKLVGLHADLGLFGKANRRLNVERGELQRQLDEARAHALDMETSLDVANAEIEQLRGSRETPR